jgi:hypothetical protein
MWLLLVLIRLLIVYNYGLINLFYFTLGCEFIRYSNNTENYKLRLNLVNLLIIIVNTLTKCIQYLFAHIKLYLVKLGFGFIFSVYDYVNNEYILTINSIYRVISNRLFNLIYSIMMPIMISPIKMNTLNSKKEINSFLDSL